MPLWEPKPTLALVQLIHKNNPNKPKTLEDLVKAFHKCQPYNGVCQGCCINPWTQERIVRKIKALINEANALAEEKGTEKDLLVMPPKAVKPSKNKSKGTKKSTSEKATPTTLEEMLKAPIEAVEEAPKKPKKTTRKGPERRSTKKTLESVAHNAAVKAGTKTERRKRA